MEKQRRLRTWLYNIVDSGKVENLEWIDKEKKIFKIPWKHESRNDWDPSHAQIFTEWALFTGKYRVGIDKPDYKMFKTRLRCAFNKAPDIEEVVEMRRYKGATPFRVYRLLPYDKKVSYKKPTSYIIENPVKVSKQLFLQQPPVMVEQMAECNVKSQKTMDLLQAVEAEREQQKQLEAHTAEVKEIEVVTSEIVQPSSQTTEHKEAPSQGPKNEGGDGKMPLKDDAGGQSLILLQSTRYRCALVKNLFELQKNGILCDLLLKAQGGHVIPVHANIMCASSPFFKQKVDHWEVGHSGDTEGGCMVIRFDDIPFDILNGIIQFIYMGEFEVSRGALHKIQSAADNMKLDDLGILCEHVLKALRGTLIDEKNNKPILPKQAPLMSPVEQPSKLMPIPVPAPIPVLIQPGITTPSGFVVPQKPTGKIITSIPPPSEQTPTTPSSTEPQTRPVLLIPKSVLNSTESQNSWHIPQSTTLIQSPPVTTPSSEDVIHGQQNPLDVLCQAVEETIHTESQSEGEESNLVIDESEKQGKNEKFHPSTVTRSVMPNKLVDSIPPVHLTDLSHEPVRPANNIPYVRTQSIQGSLTIPPSHIQPVTVVPDNAKILHTKNINKEINVSQKPQPTLVIPRSIINGSISPVNESKPQNPIYRCHVCMKVFAENSLLDSHMNIHSGESELKQIKPVTEVKKKNKHTESANVSDEQIRSIIDRIKSKTGEEFSSSSKSENKRSSSGDLPAPKHVKKIQNISSDVVVIEDDDSAKDEEVTSSKQTDKTNKHRSLSIPPPSEMKETLFTDNNKYQCTRCKTVFTSQDNLNFHGKSCSCKPIEEISLAKYSCDCCSQMYASKVGLELHKKVCGIPPVVLDHICDQCGKMFAQEADLDVHIKRHNKIKNLTCKVCKKVCKNQLLLKFHVEMHASRKLRFSCMACGKHFLTKKKLELHVQMHVSRMEKTEKDRLYECDLCKSTFMNKSALIVHINEHDENQQKKTKEIQEPQEEDSLSSNNTLMPTVGELNEGVKQVMPPTMDTENDTSIDVPDQEPNSEENNVTSRSCLICNEAFPDHVKKMVHLMSHFQFHSDPAKVICQICTMTVDKMDIPAHEKYHTQNMPLQCPHCDGSFANTDELNNHVSEDHHLEAVGGIAEFSCQTCNAVFSTNEGLQEHEQGHASTNKVLTCNICNKIFNHKYATHEYKRHMCSHTGEKPIPCRFCDKRFRDYSGRSQHEKKVHNRGPLARGRRKGFRPARLSPLTPREVPLTSNERSSRPPPLVNLNMLSDEVKRQFFPALVTNKPSFVCSDTNPSGDDTSEEEDLSIMVASKGHQSTESLIRDQQSINLPSRYNKPIYTSQATQQNYDSCMPVMAINPYSRYPLPRPPFELLSHLTVSKGNPVLMNNINTINSVSAIRMHHQQPSDSHCHPSNSRAVLMDSSTGSYDTTIHQPSVAKATTRLAKVGDQLKVSTMVAPQVRKPPPLITPDNIDKPHYPPLPKKRPLDPKYLSNLGEKNCNAGDSTKLPDSQNISESNLEKEKAFQKEKSVNIAVDSISVEMKI